MENKFEEYLKLIHNDKSNENKIDYLFEICHLFILENKKSEAMFCLNKILNHVSLVNAVYKINRIDPNLLDDKLKIYLKEKEYGEITIEKVFYYMSIISGFYSTEKKKKFVKIVPPLILTIFLVILSILTILNIYFAIISIVVVILFFESIAPKLIKNKVKPSDLYFDEYINIDNRIYNLFKGDEENIELLNAKYIDFIEAKNDMDIANAILNFKK